MKFSKTKKGFTITELVIVIAVIAILVAVLIPTFGNVFEQARQSAALQTCSNALKDYSAIAAGQGKTPEDGLVFVADGYVYVYLNSALHLVGELKTLSRINTDSTFFQGTLEYAGVEDTDDVYGIMCNGKTLLINNETDTPNYDLAASGDKNAECVYFYTVVINETTYEGFFTLEQGENPSYQTQGSTYSHVFGYGQNTTSPSTRAITLIYIVKEESSTPIS